MISHIYYCIKVFILQQKSFSLDFNIKYIIKTVLNNNKSLIFNKRFIIIYWNNRIMRREGSKTKESDLVVLVEKKDDDRIILVEQMWKYKRDFTRIFGIKHAYIVTTTMSGKKTMRDLILDRKNNTSARSFEYSSYDKASNI